MSQKYSNLRKVFLIWVLANILGISAAAAIPILFTSLGRSINSGVGSVFIFSVPISLAQWLALRRNARTSILWVLTIPVGILLYLLIYRVIPDGLMQFVDDESIAVITTDYLLIGFLIGLLQWFLLRRQYSGSALWILGSAIGIGFSFWFILATDLINQSGFFAFIVGVLMYTIITGVILIRLLTHTTQSEMNMA
jgi:hypothetical protein